MQPMTFQQVLVRISGTTPMLMHNRRLSDPLDEYTRLIKEVTSKRIKTDADHAEIARLEFLGGLYYDKKAGVHVPGENIDATVRDGAKLIKKGMDIKRGVQCVDLVVPLIYEGPRSPDQLYPAFADRRRVGVNKGSSTIRCRPIFAEWGCEFTLALDVEVINPTDLRRCVELAGARVGLGDYRPRYGRFTVDEWVLG